MKVLGDLRRGHIFVISAPAGTGKTTLVRMLTKEFSCVVESVSYTTRPMRSQEIEGCDYHFISESEFKKKIQEEEFLEYAFVFGYYYGTSKKYVEEKLAQGKHVALVIDTQGAMALKDKIDATFIFIRPPNFEELKKRLCGRQSDTEDAIATRLSWANQEMSMAKNYNYLVVNENLEMAYDVLRSIFIAEEHKLKLR